MRNTFALLGLIALAACGSPSEPPATDVHAPALSIQPVAFRPCPNPDPMQACAYDKAKAPEELEAALKGDYQAQRNVSYLHHQSHSWIVQNEVQGCAWRMVIMVSRPADATYDDDTMYRIQCGKLSGSDLAEAKAVAQLIYSQVHGSDLPALPPVPA